MVHAALWPSMSMRRLANVQFGPHGLPLQPHHFVYLRGVVASLRWASMGNVRMALPSIKGRDLIWAYVSTEQLVKPLQKFICPIFFSALRQFQDLWHPMLLQVAGAPICIPDPFLLCSYKPRESYKVILIKKPKYKSCLIYTCLLNLLQPMVHKYNMLIQFLR